MKKLINFKKEFKNMAHINEIIDYTAETYVVFQNKVLLRLHDKYNLWLSVGGHIELDEDPNQAAIREVKEEVGLDVELCEELLSFKGQNENYKELIPPFFMNIHKISATHRHVTMVYFAKAFSDRVVEQAEDKSGRWRWMTKKEIENAQDMKNSIKFYALRALEKLAE